MKIKTKALITLLVILTVLIGLYSSGAVADGPKKILILPFKINAPKELTYIQKGIMDMLASRLAWEDKVVVLDEAIARQAFDAAQGSINDNRAREIGASAGADYVLFGSMTVIGQSVSLDAKVVNVKDNKPAISANAQDQGLGKIVPLVTSISANLNNKVFQRSAAKQRTASQSTTESRRHPETLLITSGSGKKDDFFIRKGYWKSQDLNMAISGIDVGDVDGDSKNEIVYSGHNKIYVGRMEGGRLVPVTVFKGTVTDSFISIDVADINGNGLAEIFVNNQVNYKNSSYVLEWSDGKLKPIVKKSPWAFRIITPSYGPTLIGQKEDLAQTPKGKIFKMRASGNNYVPSSEMKLPYDEVNVVNFNIGTFSKETGLAVAVFDELERLELTSFAGYSLWDGNERFGGSIVYIERSPVNRDMMTTNIPKSRSNYYYIPPRIITADLDGNGEMEILVAKGQKSVTSKFMTGLRGISEGAVYSMRLEGASLMENWRSPPLSGYPVDYQLKDHNNDGEKELIIAVIYRSGDFSFSKGRSAIITYSLKGLNKKKGGNK